MFSEFLKKKQKTKEEKKKIFSFKNKKKKKKKQKIEPKIFERRKKKNFILLFFFCFFLTSIRIVHLRCIRVNVWRNNRAENRNINRRCAPLRHHRTSSCTISTTEITQQSFFSHSDQAK